jgi:hypothetical protein
MGHVEIAGLEQVAGLLRYFVQSVFLFRGVQYDTPVAASLLTLLCMRAPLRSGFSPLLALRRHLRLLVCSMKYNT